MGIAYLVVYPIGCLSYNKWDRPNQHYVVFKYQTKVWNRITLKELPIELKTPSFIFSSPDDEAKKLGQRVISAGAIETLYVDSQSQYKTILREAIENAAGSRGGEMVPYGKGGWLGVDWFRDQPADEACVKLCEKKGVNSQHCSCNNLFREKQYL